MTPSAVGVLAGRTSLRFGCVVAICAFPVGHLQSPLSRFDIIGTIRLHPKNIRRPFFVSEPYLLSSIWESWARVSRPGQVKVPFLIGVDWPLPDARDKVIPTLQIAKTEQDASTRVDTF